MATLDEMPTKTPQQRLDWMCNMIADESGEEPENVKPGTNLVNDLGMDSIDLMEVVIAVEEKFAITFDDGKEFADIPTVQAWASYVERMLAAKANK